MCRQSAVSADLQEYFFPKEDASVKQRQQQWVKSVALRRKSAAVLGESDKAAFFAAPGRYALLLPSHQAFALYSLHPIFWMHCGILCIQYFQTTQSLLLAITCCIWQHVTLSVH